MFTNLTHSIRVCSRSSQSWCWWLVTLTLTPVVGGKPSGLPPHFLLAPHISGYAELWVTGCGRSTEDRPRIQGLGGTAVTWNPGTRYLPCLPCCWRGTADVDCIAVRWKNLPVDFLEKSIVIGAESGDFDIRGWEGERLQLRQLGPPGPPVGHKLTWRSASQKKDGLQKIGPQQCTTKRWL